MLGRLLNIPIFMLNSRNLPNCATLVFGKVQRSRLGSTGPLGACLPRSRLLMAARSRVIFQTMARYIICKRWPPMPKHGSPSRKVNVGSAVKPRRGWPVGGRPVGNNAGRWPMHWVSSLSFGPFGCRYAPLLWPLSGLIGCVNMG